MEKIPNENLLGVGRTAEIYPWNEKKVLKLFFSWCPTDWIESEFKLIKSIQNFNIPITKGFEIIKIKDRLGIIYERIYGISLLEELIVNPEKVRSIGIILAETHYDIHQLEANHLDPLHIRLFENIKSSKVISKHKQYVLRVLDTLPEGNSLCHMDYHPGQILNSDQGVRIIDWGSACKGNILADVAFTNILLRIAQIQSPAEILHDNLQILRNSLCEAYLERYFQLRDIKSNGEIEKWVLVMAVLRLSEGLSGESQILNGLVEEQLEKVARQ